MNLDKIGIFISKCRKEKGLTQEQLAQKLNLTSKAISKWECGNGLPDVSIMLELCEVLGINIMDLLSGEDTKIKIYKRRTEGTMVKKITLSNGLRELKDINNVDDVNVVKIYEINERKNNVTFKVVLKGIDIIEHQGYFEVNMEVEDETGEISAIIISRSNDEIKKAIDSLEINQKYLMKGFLTPNEQMLGDKLLVVSAIKKVK